MCVHGFRNFFKFLSSNHIIMHIRTHWLCRSAVMLLIWKISQRSIHRAPWCLIIWKTRPSIYNYRWALNNSAAIGYKKTDNSWLFFKETFFTGLSNRWNDQSSTQLERNNLSVKPIIVLGQIVGILRPIAFDSLNNYMRLYTVHATKASSVARSLKLSNVDLG